MPILELLEPWCDTVYTDELYSVGRYQDYIEMERSKTAFDLQERIQPIDNEKNNDIFVEFDALQLTNENFQYLTQLPEILSDDKSLELGKFELDIFTVVVNKIKTYEEDLIVCQT